MEKVSIVVPVYNAAAYILQTIQNVKQQTYTDWELILVEDRSSDDSRKILEDVQKSNCDSRIRFLLKEQNEGAARARNDGIAIAAGRYLAFLDADDVWKKDKLQREVEFIQKKEAGFVFTSYEFGDEEAEPTGKIVHAPATLTYQKALSRTVIFTSTVLFDLEKIDKQQIKMPLVPSEDTATWWQILRSGITAYGMDETLVIYRRPKKSLSSNKGQAVKRIWFLYRKVEKLSFIKSSSCFFLWALRATLRRI